MPKQEDIKQLSASDLKAKVKDLNEDIFKLGMQKKIGTLKDKHVVIKKRRELARILTSLNEKARRA
jgi:ribosomal protein L29